MSKRRIAVIGAGSCGLLAIKAAKEEDLEPVCFEKTGEYGGSWFHHEEDVDGLPSAMKSTILNSSKEMCAISDFPPPAEFPVYMHNTLVWEYISSLAKSFDLLKHINFHHLVTKVEPSESYCDTGRWTVITEDLKTKEEKAEEFDGVMVCTGHHVYPNIPLFAEQEKFKGKIMHSHYLKSIKGFEDMVVVVVGAGNSGMDAAVEISRVSKQVYISRQRGTSVHSRVEHRGLPIYLRIFRRHLLFFEYLFPRCVVSFVENKFVNRIFNHKTYDLEPAHDIRSIHPSISEALLLKMRNGTVLDRGNILKFTESGVIFDNEEKETKVDAVVFATGYLIKFPFLSEDILKIKENRVALYKLIYPPDLPHPTLAVLGLVQPSGPGFPVSDIQCRLAARVMSEKAKLPSKEQMYADIRTRDDLNHKSYVDSPSHTIECDHIAYQDEIAAMLGVKPNFWELAIKDPKLFWALVRGPSLAYQYRLKGPHTWQGAREAILTYKQRVLAPLWKPSDPATKSHKSYVFKVFLALAFIIFYTFSYFASV